MTRLFRVELARYRSRRVIALLVLLAALVAALVAFKSAWDTRARSRPRSGHRAAPTPRSKPESGDVEQELTRCLADPEQYLGTGATAQECRDDFTRVGAATTFPGNQLDLRGTLKGNGVGVALLVVGTPDHRRRARSPDADWSSGSMRNQLLFEPRRARVWAAKAVAVTVGERTRRAGRPRRLLAQRSTSSRSIATSRTGRA